MFMVLEYPWGRVKSDLGRAGQEEALAQAGREGQWEGAHLCVQLQQWTQSAWHCPQTLRGAS